MRPVRRPDLNIVTAEWAGWAHRTDPDRATQVRTILAGTDPVALDYYGAKHLVLPLSGRRLDHDPDHPDSAIRRFLEFAVHGWGEGAIGDGNIRIVKHDSQGEACG
jgi:hypothetical protein